MLVQYHLISGPSRQLSAGGHGLNYVQKTLELAWQCTEKGIEQYLKSNAGHQRENEGEEGQKSLGGR